MSDARQNSVMQLAELYNVVIGVALSISVYHSVDKTAYIILVKHSQIINLITLIIILVPFYHGAVRHLFATYVEDSGSTRIKNGALVTDFFLLFFEGCVFVLLGSVLDDTLKFTLVLIFLLVLDSIWGFLAWLAFTGAQAQYAERSWALINMITAGLLGILVIFAGGVFQMKPFSSQIGLFAVIGIRTVVDYFVSWKFYFPDHSTSKRRQG